MATEIDLTPSPRLLEVLGDIPLEPWQCLSELIDNSIDDMRRRQLSGITEGLCVEVDVTESSPGRRTLSVVDNGSGMTQLELETALKAGATTKGRYGTLGLFGMGFNIATARLGTVTRVTTAQAEDRQARRVEINFQAMQRAESFRVPVAVVDKPNPKWHGTRVEVVLKGQLADQLADARQIETVRRQLGDVYSYMLRQEVPGLKAPFAGSKIPATIRVQGELVKPLLPCIWSDSREVPSYGQRVKAVQYIEVALIEATACLVCGYWDRNNGPQKCEECGSDKLESRARRIWGWLGVQRYIDPARYGIDFLRQGRKILHRDKSVFTYTDPDTLLADVEYPIEMPANRGRLVGEIHLDHVRVTYQKNDFDRTTIDWQKAIEQIRGKEQLKPRSAHIPNTSPLARLFAAFRRNDPGLRCLTPGDGRRAIHEEARKWALFFDQGVPAYLEDSAWYDAAQQHESQARPPTPGPLGTSQGESVGGSRGAMPGTVPTGESVFGRPASGGSGPASPVKKTGSREDEMKVWREIGVPRRELSGKYLLGEGLGEWEIEVVAVQTRVTTPTGKATPATAGTCKRGYVEVFFSPDHEIFRDFGQGLREVVLLQVAESIQVLVAKDVPITCIFAQLVLANEDLKQNTAALVARIGALVDQVRNRMLLVVQNSPEQYWATLSAFEKSCVETAAALEQSTVPFEKIVANGEYVHYLRPEGIVQVIRSIPLPFFGGAVFRPAVQQRPEPAAKRIVDRILGSFEALGLFLGDSLLRQSDDLRLAAAHEFVVASAVVPDSFGD